MPTPTVEDSGENDAEQPDEPAEPVVESADNSEGESEPDSSDTDDDGSDLTDDLEEMAEEVSEVAGVTEEDVDEGRVGVQTADLTDDSEPADDDDELSDWFDGVEDADLSNDDEDDDSDDSDGGSGSSVSMGGDDTDLAAAADKLDNIAARMATQGLPEDEKDELEGEFEEFFSLMGLGDSWVEFLEEYILVDGMDEEVDPATRALGTTLAALVLVMYMRPDGQEVAASTWSNMQNIGQKLGDS